MANPTSGNGPSMMMQAAAGGGAARAAVRRGRTGPGKRIEVPIKKAGSGIEDKLHTWPFLVRSEFLMSIADHRGADHLVADHQCAAGRAPQPDPHAQSVQGALVLPGPAGDAGVLRSLVCGRGAAQLHHRGPDADSVSSISTQGQRLLHLQRAQVRDSDFLLRLPRAVGLVHHHRNLFPRPRMELVLARAGVGSASGRGADQRRFAVPVRLPRLLCCRRFSA